jgi:fido (protein-threonine AMPylation protein)
VDAKRRKKASGPGPGRPPYEEVLATLDEEVQLLRDNLGGLPRAVEADHILRSIWLDDVHHSTAIEGNTMTRAQVEDLVERRRASATLVESLEVEGYARAADWVYRHAADYSGVPTDVLSEVHRQVIELAWALEAPSTRDRPGQWRSAGVSVRGLQVSLPVAIPADLQQWSESTGDLADRHPLEHAAFHHAWLERIHPFVDGNGRVGRLILNWMLLQRGYPPAVIHLDQRPRYLRGLRIADGGNDRPLTEVIARAVSGALNRLLIPNLAGDARLVPLSSLATSGPYGAAYLRQLAIAGRLKAIREGRLWLSSRAWLNEYAASRDPRGTRSRGR